MVVDADDCISNQIVSFVKKNATEPGWYCNSGYIYREGSKFLFKKNVNFNTLCGTCLIIRTSFVRNIINSEMYYRHAEKISDDNIEFKPIPFEGAIYTINNGENHFMSKNNIKHLNSGGHIAKVSPFKKIKRLFNKVLTYRLKYLGNQITQNYGLRRIPVASSQRVA